MLLIDEAELVDGVSIARYTVRGDEFFLQGHFPGNTVVPGVVLCEMMGQSACLLIQPEEKGFTPYFAAMREVRFRNKVLPGDTITLQSTLKTRKGAFYIIESAGHVDGQLCVSGTLTFRIVQET